MPVPHSNHLHHHYFVIVVGAIVCHLVLNILEVTQRLINDPHFRRDMTSLLYQQSSSFSFVVCQPHTTAALAMSSFLVVIDRSPSRKLQHHLGQFAHFQVETFMVKRSYHVYLSEI